MRQEVLRIERVTCREGGRPVLNHFSFSILEGEIMGLQPVNTYGLDTLLRLLTDNPPLYYGYVYYMETCVNSWNEGSRGRNRISVIGSESSLVKGLDILTNVFVLRPGFGQYVIHNELLRSQLSQFLQEIRIPLDPMLPVERLTPFERVVVEILRAVVAGHHLIILREIGTVVSENDMRELYRIMRQYAARGFAFLFISLHFEEICQVCTSAAIMSNANIDMILRGEELSAGIPRTYYEGYHRHVTERLRRRNSGKEGEVVFEAEHLYGQELEELSFQVREGECIVIQSLEGSVYRELTELLSQEVRSEGAVFRLRSETVRWFVGRGVFVLREEAARTMLFPELSPLDNLCIGLDGRLPSIWRKRRARETARQEYLNVFQENIFSKRTGDLTALEGIRLIYMRILLARPEVVILMQPFKGADVEQRFLICELMELLLQKGIGIVILAINMADALAVADRVIRLERWEGHMKARNYTKEEFGSLPMSMPWVEAFDESGSPS